MNSDYFYVNSCGRERAPGDGKVVQDGQGRRTCPITLA